MNSISKLQKFKSSILSDEIMKKLYEEDEEEVQINISRFGDEQKALKLPFLKKETKEKEKKKKKKVTTSGIK